MRSLGRPGPEGLSRIQESQVRPGARTLQLHLLGPSPLLERGRWPAGPGRLVPAELPLAPAPARPPEPQPRRPPSVSIACEPPLGPEHQRQALSPLSPEDTAPSSWALGTRAPRHLQGPGTCSWGSRASVEAAEDPGAGFGGHKPAAGSAGLHPPGPGCVFNVSWENPSPACPAESVSRGPGWRSPPPATPRGCPLLSGAPAGEGVVWSTYAPVDAAAWLDSVSILLPVVYVLVFPALPCCGVSLLCCSWGTALFYGGSSEGEGREPWGAQDPFPGPRSQHIAPSQGLCDA